MRITIKNTVNGKVLSKEFIVKVQHDLTKPYIKKEKDQYGRYILTVWRERTTLVNAHVYDHDKNNSRTTWSGMTQCDYHDLKHYSKKIGKKLAWFACVDEMYSTGAVNKDEADALKCIDLDATSFVIDMASGTVHKSK